MGIQHMLLRPSGPSVGISSQYITSTLDSPLGTATASYILSNSGQATGVGNSQIDYPGEWLILGSASDYQMRWSHVSGSLPTSSPGAQNTWFGLVASRTISLSASLNNTEFETGIYIEISRISDGIPLTSANISLHVRKGTAV